MEIGKELIENNTHQILDEVSINIITKLKPYFEAGLIVMAIYIVYRLIRFFLTLRERKRIKKAYYNTEDILERVKRIEEKIDRLLIKRPNDEKVGKKTKKK